MEGINEQLMHSMRGLLVNNQVENEFTGVTLRLLDVKDDFFNYYYYNKAFNDQHVGKVEQLVNPSQLANGGLSISNQVDNEYRRSKIFWIKQHRESLWLYTIVAWFIKDANSKVYKFNLSSMIDSLQYTEYHASEEGHYDWHIDLGNGPSSTRKLSIVIQLSDPSEYEGGDLVIKYSKDDTVIPKGKGNIVVFPSFLLHRVTPVTKGIRKTLVGWIHGPAFQ